MDATVKTDSGGCGGGVKHRLTLPALRVLMRRSNRTLDVIFSRLPPSLLYLFFRMFADDDVIDVIFCKLSFIAHRIKKRS